MTGPLDDVRVLDFTALLQGPLATQMFGDMGAEVIKVERPEGEWMRHWGILGSRTHDETDSFLAVNRNKRSVSADLKDPVTRAKILELGRDVDVVVENFRPGVMERLGLGYEAFREVNPRIVYASASGYGQTGPYRDRPGQDLLIQALSGMMQLTGKHSDAPTPAGIALADEYAGMHLAVGILAALLHARTSGTGQRVAVDLLGCAIAAQAQELTAYLNGEPRRPLPRAEEAIGFVGGTAPMGTYRARDDYFVLAMTPCDVLARILDLSWLSDFQTTEEMYDGRDEVHRRLSEHFATQDRDHWLSIFHDADVWCAPVHDYEHMVIDPQVVHKEMFWDVPVGDSGNVFTTVRSPIEFSETPVGLRLGVPRVGQHTADYFPEPSALADGGTSDEGASAHV